MVYRFIMSICLYSIDNKHSWRDLVQVAKLSRCVPYTVPPARMLGNVKGACFRSLWRDSGIIGQGTGHKALRFWLTRAICAPVRRWAAFPVYFIT